MYVPEEPPIITTLALWFTVDDLWPGAPLDPCRPRSPAESVSFSSALWSFPPPAGSWSRPSPRSWEWPFSVSPLRPTEPSNGSRAREAAAHPTGLVVPGAPRLLAGRSVRMTRASFLRDDASSIQYASRCYASSVKLKSSSCCCRLHMYMPSSQQQ